MILDIREPSPSVPNAFVMVHGDRYLLFATEARDASGTKVNVPVSESRDLVNWTFLGDAMPTVGAWAVPEATWAPDVLSIGDRWVLYYTGRVGGVVPDTQCIGAAVSDEPTGPYAPLDEPIVCQLDRRGSIDPRHFVDAAGARWLHWKSDDNADVDGTTTASIHAARLDATGTALASNPTPILEVSQPWEGRIVEAPDMVADPDGRLWLFYSGNWFNQAAYALGVARCDTPAGPCHKPFDGPWLASNAQGAGPGEAALFEGRDGTLRIVYSPVAQDFDDLTSVRPVALGALDFDATGPYLVDPAAAPDLLRDGALPAVGRAP